MENARPDPEANTSGDSVKERFNQQIEDARELLNFAIAEGRAVEDRIIEEIDKSEALLLSSTFPSLEARTAFEKAYRDLARFLAPVTVQTLRATADAAGRTTFLLARRKPRSEAIIWSRRLWGLTSLFALLALFGENLNQILKGAELPPWDKVGNKLCPWEIVNSVFQVLVPFTYGALGSVANLLRSCHQYIYKRQFDPNRIPEYYNRIFLGIVSGGVIVLYIQGDTGQGTIKFGAAALGFLAGYSNDVLFAAIERTIAAILPKADTETSRGAQSTPTSTSIVSPNLPESTRAEQEGKPPDGNTDINKW
jgi:hypothetical protein